MSTLKIKRALISVSDKTAIVDFASELAKLNIEILSTGGTAKLLKDNKIPVVEVADFTGYPEIMDGRVKTLNPKIHGGILARRNQDEKIMAQNDILPIDLVVVNLYPFAKTVAQPNCSFDDAIENIDIGGPTMLRSAAKNHKWVTTIVDHQDFAKVVGQLKENGNTNYETRKELALKVFNHTTYYDGMIADYLGREDDGFTNHFNLQLKKKTTLRYGENPHQKAALYVEKQPFGPNIAGANLVQGKELSYNNIVDADAALDCVRSFETPCCVIVKHANPCGVALRDNILSAYLDAYRTDPTSAFGGIIAFNQELDKQTAQEILSKQFVEVIIAPKVNEAAQVVLQSKPNVRVLEVGELDKKFCQYNYKRVSGGLLSQNKDLLNIDLSKVNCVTKLSPSDQQLKDLVFAFKVAKFVKSNAIVYAKNQMTIGVGAGQMSRVYSAKIAAIKAADENLDIKDAVMASDAFFPFPDSVEQAAKSGIKAIIQPGGSMRDEQVIATADALGLIMVFTGVRHFNH